MKAIGICVLDPHGTLETNTILRSIPNTVEENRITYLAAADPVYAPASPLLPKPADMLHEIYISTTVAVLKAAIAETINPTMTRFDDALHSLITTLAYYPEATLWDIYRIIYDPNVRRKILSYLPSSEFVTQLWWARFSQLSDSSREQIVSPVLSRIGKWLRSKPIAHMLLQPPLEDPFATLRDGGLLFLDLSGEALASEADFLLDYFVARFKMNMLPRIGRSNNNRVFLIVDECQRARGVLPSIVRELRKANVASVLISQSFAEWSETLSKVVLDNYSSLLSFSVRDDSNKLTHLFGMSKEELGSLDRHVLAVRMALPDHTLLPPFTLTTIDVDRQPDPEKFARIKKQSQERFCRRRDDVEAHLVQLLGHDPEQGSNQPTYIFED